MAKEFQVKVGILTASPRGVLDVYGIDSEIMFGSATSDQLGYLGNSQRTSYGNVLFAKNLKGTPSSDNFKTIGTVGSGGGYSAIELSYAGNVNIYGSNAATTADATVTPVRMVRVLGSNGNVGIGTSGDPAYKLEVNGIGYFVGNVGIGTASSPTYKLEVNGTGFFGQTLKVSGIDSELLIGSASPGQTAIIGNSRRLDYGDILFAKNLAGVASSNNYKTPNTFGTGFGYSAIELGYSGVINFYGNSAATTAGAVVTPTRNMTILGNGNVGIGVTPSYRLHVVGTTYFDGASQVTGSAIFNSTVSIQDVLSMNSKKITNLAAGSSASDAVRFDQLAALGSKWTFSAGTGVNDPIYRASNVYIGSGTPSYDYQVTIEGHLHLRGYTPLIFSNTAGGAFVALASESSDNVSLNAFGDLQLKSNNSVIYLKVRKGGATTIGAQSTSVQHALQVEGLSTENLAAMRVIFRNNKNNNLQIGDSVNSWIACHNLGTSQIVDLGNKNGTVLTRVNYDFETAREIRTRFDGIQWGNLVQTNQVKKRVAGYINSDSGQTQTNCAILFNCNYTNTGTHKFLVTVEGTISGKYFKYSGIISYTSGTLNSLVSAASGNDITDCSVSVNVSSNYPYLIITKTTGTFASTSLCITTQATAENNNIDSQAPSIYTVVFS
jgi:hypothetical protein